MKRGFEPPSAPRAPRKSNCLITWRSWRTWRFNSISPLEFCVFGGSGEGNDIAHVLHPRCVHNRALKAQAEARVRDGAVSSQVAVPVVRLLVQLHLVHPAVEHV